MRLKFQPKILINKKVSRFVYPISEKVYAIYPLRDAMQMSSDHEKSQV